MDEPQPSTSSSQKGNGPFTLEKNPKRRASIQRRLLRSLHNTLNEFASLVGQQAVVLIVNPEKPIRVFGTQPLERIIKNCEGIINEELQGVKAEEPPESDDKFCLPPLVFDGEAIQIDYMTQQQLRSFIPLMLKYSTGRGKPGWGDQSRKPVWWPNCLPWANVRADTRSEAEKEVLSYTHALREVILNCYKYHGRLDLLNRECCMDSCCIDLSNQVQPLEDETGSVEILLSDQVQLLKDETAGVETNENSAPKQVKMCECIPAEADTTQESTIEIEVSGNSQCSKIAFLTYPDGTVTAVPVYPNTTVITLPNGSAINVQDMHVIQTVAVSAEGADGVQCAQVETNENFVDKDEQNEVITTLDLQNKVVVIMEDGKVHIGNVINNIEQIAEATDSGLITSAVG